MRLRGHVALAVLVLGGCAHEQPFQPPDTTTDQPFHPGSPAQLTYNPGADLRPDWLPDGSAFIYAWQQVGQPNKDRCLGIINAAGGTRVRTICNPAPTSADSTDLFDSPSPSPDGRLLYIRGSSPPTAISPSWAGVYLGPLADPLQGTKLLNLPYIDAGGVMHGHLSDARWVSDTRVMYLDESIDYPRPCGGCPPDTVITGLDIVDLDLSGPVPSPAIVPGTSQATSMALTANGDTLVYTLLGDSRVFARAIATGQVSTLHDFGALGAARDVTVRGGQLVAVVGNRPEGGQLASVDLATGTESILPGAELLLFFRRPVFAPAGSPVRLVVEGYHWTSIVIVPGVEDTVVSKDGDLYLYEAP
jgi:hypothetical protein